MKKFLVKFLWFLIIPMVTYVPVFLWGVPVLFEQKFGPNTQKQIERSFANALEKDYDLLILGNSRIYRGVNPEIFSLKSYNFAHDNDSYNQLYHKLRYLYDQGKEIDYLLLGVDYFQFSIFSDQRNYAYQNFLGEGYMKDYPNEFYKVKYYTNLIKPTKIVQFLRRSGKGALKENGQYIKEGTAKESDSISRDFKRLTVQEKYFEKIIDLCQQKGIKVFLVMPPVRQNELRNYSVKEIEEFYSFLSTYYNENVVFFDFTTDTSFTIKDYSDITHLNASAANRFSEKINDSIQAEIE